MAKISLRAYNQEIETMINEGQIQEAIAHCRHILKIYPKHVDTYRLLGKAYLESRQYTNAIDIFQRVLSAIPDDFVSHIGMSLIREDEGDIETATLHMERAFEKQPYNSAIQDELRRLYGKRDGMEPPKVRLTQGALARMYLKGNLWQQGISELRAALAKEPARVDLQAILAQSYAETGQKAKALETASAILKKFPHNLIANRLLAEMLSDDEHPQVMKVCRQRLFGLSPYEMHISEYAPTVADVPDRAITLEQLDWIAAQEELQDLPEEAQPDWATAVGVSLGSESEEEALPAWLTEAEGEKESTDEQDYFDETAETEEESKEFIPDWMQEAGWEASTGEVSETEVDWDSYEAKKDSLAPADIPDWLKEQAPSQVADHAEDDLKGELKEGDTAWLTNLEKETGELPPLAEGEEDTEQDGLPEWVKEMEDEKEAAPPRKKEELPDWLKEGEKAEKPISSIPKAEAGEDIPDWLADMGREEDAEEVEELTLPVAESESAFEAKPDESLPTWLEDLGEEEDDTQKTAMAWLADLGEEDVEVEDAGETEEAEETMPPVTEEGAIPAAEMDEGLPDWLADMEEPKETEEAEEAMPSVAEEGAVPAAEMGEGLPDWLADMEEPKETEEAEEVMPPVAEEEAVPAMEMPEAFEKVEEREMLDLEDEDATMAWLESLAAKRGVPDEELVTSAEERAKAEGTRVARVAKEAEEAEEPEAAEEIIPPVAEEEAAPAAEMDEGVPDWLADLEGEGVVGEIEEAEEVLQPAAEEEAIPVAEIDEGLPDWLADMEEPKETGEAEEAMPPVTEEAAVPAAEMDESLPDWLADMEEPKETEEAEEPMPPVTEEGAVPVVEMDEGLPDWLADMEEPKETEEAEETMPPIAEEEAVPAAEVAEEVPDWLAELEGGGAVEEAEEVMPPVAEEETVPAMEMPEAFEKVEEPEIPDLEDEDATMAWLESLAAKRGVPDEELVTSAEERARVEKAEETKEVEEVLPPAAEEEAIPVAEIDEVLPDWLKDMKEPKETEEAEEAMPPIAEEAAVPAAEVDEGLPDWLAGLEGEGVVEEAEEVMPPVAEEGAIPAAEMGEGVPDWLADLEGEGVERELEEAGVTEEPEATEEVMPPVAEEEAIPVAEMDEGLPDWLADIEEAEEPEAAEEPAPPAMEAEPSTLAEDEEELPTWLDEVKEEEDAQETFIGWLSDFQKEAEEIQPPREEEPQEPQPPPEIEPEEAMLEQVQEEEEPETAPPAELTEAVEEEVAPPAWISDGDMPGDEAEEYAWLPSTPETPPEEELLNLNTASLAQIESLDNVGFRVAEAIVSHREEHGYFTNFEDLGEVEGIDADTLEVLKEQAEVLAPPKAEKEEVVAPSDRPEPEDQYQATLFEAQDALKSGQVEDAVTHLEKLIDKKERLEEVISYLSEATYKYPMNIPILKALGDAYMKTDQLQEALDTYSKAEDLLR